MELRHKTDIVKRNSGTTIKGNGLSSSKTEVGILF